MNATAACCSPPKHWSRRFLKRKKLLQCLRAAWAAWITKPKQHVNSNSRTRKGPAVLLFRMLKAILFPPRPRTPKVIHSLVTALCDKIVPGGRPCRVSVRPERDALKNECFPNVRQKTARYGGRIQHGWAIAERPGLFIEAQFHAVWIDPTGELVDVTPTQNGETETLFLPDPEEVFDENAL